MPADLAVVGFDDIEASDYAPVPLTTVHYGADELSKAAVDRLLELIKRPERLPRPKQIFIEPKLVVRELVRRQDRARPPAERRDAGRGHGIARRPDLTTMDRRDTRHG